MNSNLDAEYNDMENRIRELHLKCDMEFEYRHKVLNKNIFTMIASYVSGEWAKSLKRSHGYLGEVDLLLARGVGSENET